MVTKGSYAAILLVCEKLDIEEGSTTAGESREDLFPATLLFIAVCELDMCVLKRDFS